MAAGIIPWFIGKDLKIQITPQDVAANGAFSDNGAGTFSFAGRLDAAESSNELTKDNISPLNVFQGNPVPVEINGNYVITEIMAALAMPANAGADTFGKGNILMKCSTLSFYHKLVVTKYDRQNSPASWETETIYGLMSIPRGVTYGKGKNICRATFDLIAVFDTGTGAVIANPAYS